MLLEKKWRNEAINCLKISLTYSFLNTEKNVCNNVWGSNFKWPHSPSYFVL